MNTDWYMPSEREDYIFFNVVFIIREQIAREISSGPNKIFVDSSLTLYRFNNTLKSNFLIASFVESMELRLSDN
jgi:hypothetical protein